MVWNPGQQLQNGKYVIGEVLGRGGFGITYKALHVELQEQVVVKTPDKYLKTDPEYGKYVERFIKEGRMLAKLSRNAHPNIVRVKNLFQEGETHCLVMDFVPGETLFQVVKRRGKLSEAEAIHCMRQIAGALASIHKVGLVHRDAHPGNIILREDGRAILIDFGIAKELVPATMSSTGDAGNKGFAPYEQLVRGSREPNADVYCLAATLYYAVTGQRPVPSLERKLHDVVLIPPQQIEPTISQELNEAILEGMALEAHERPQSMQLWLELLAVEEESQQTKSSTVDLLSPVEPDDWPISPPVERVPSPVNPENWQESIPTPPSTRKPKPQKATAIPWTQLTIVFLIYAAQSFLMAEAMATVVFVIGSVSKTMLVTVSIAWAWAAVVIVAVAWVVARVKDWYETGIEAGTVIMAIIASIAWAAIATLTWNEAVAMAAIAAVAGAVILAWVELGIIELLVDTGSEFWIVAGFFVFGLAAAGVWAVATNVFGTNAYTMATDWVSIMVFGVVFWAMVGAKAVLKTGNQLIQQHFSRSHTFLILVGTSTLGWTLGWLIYLSNQQSVS